MDDFFRNKNDEIKPTNDENENKAYTEQKPTFNDSHAYGEAQKPPVNQYYQTANGYYQPPTQQPNYYPNGYAPAMPQKPKKKKNKSIIVIVVIAVVCMAIAFAGIILAASEYNNKNGDTNSFLGQLEDKLDDNDSNGDSVDVEVQDSNAAAKKDADGNLTVAGVVEKAIDSCVLVSVYSNQDAYSYFYSYGMGGQTNGDSVLSGEGSGVIMSESKGKTYIMTCAHVISGGDKFKITLNDGTELDAEMVNFDSQTDIGVLAVNKTGLKVATFANSTQIEVGEQCIAIGCPGGSKFVNSVTSGYVSALDRPVSSSIGYNTECIQTDAAINPGNSGGALFNMQGQVIGINSSKIASTEYEGMGFAIPSNTAVKIAKSLIENGYVAGRAKIGIEYSPITNFTNASAILSALAEKGYEDAQGTIIVQTIDEASDLAKKDVKQYDMIIAVDGKTMTSTDILTSVLSSKKPGDTIKLTMARIENGKIKTFEVSCKLIESKE